MTTRFRQKYLSGWNPSPNFQYQQHYNPNNGIEKTWYPIDEESTYKFDLKKLDWLLHTKSRDQKNLRVKTLLLNLCNVFKSDYLTDDLSYTEFCDEFSRTIRGNNEITDEDKQSFIQSLVELKSFVFKTYRQVMSDFEESIIKNTLNHTIQLITE